MGAVGRNVILGNWFDETHPESLLNPKNGKYCREVLTNLRYACCGGGLYNMQVDTADLVHTLETLYKKAKNGLTAGALANIHTGDRMMALKNESSEALKVTKYTVKEYLSRRDFPVIDEPPAPELSEEEAEAMKKTRMEMSYRGELKRIATAFARGVRCECCNTFVQQPFMTPCCHVMCSGCMLLDNEGFPLENCRTRYKLDKDNVREELIELRPAMFGLKWSRCWERTESSKMTYLMEPLQGLKGRGQKVIV